MTILTDKYEIDIDEVGGRVRFYKRDIQLGEIVRRKSPNFVLNRKDFRWSQKTLKQLLAYLQTWIE